MGLVGSGWSETDPVVTCHFSRLRTPRARATDLGQDPHLHRSVHAGRLRAPHPRARETPRGRKSKKCLRAKKSIWYIVTCNVPGSLVLVVFLEHSSQTDCGRCTSSVDPNIDHPTKHSLATCEHTGGVLDDFVVVFDRDICREHSLVGRRNHLPHD